MSENTDLTNDDGSDGCIIMLTPSKPWPEELKLRVYDQNEFSTAMSTFHCFQRVKSNSKRTQFSAIEKIPSGILQTAESQTEKLKTQTAESQTEKLKTRTTESQTENQTTPDATPILQKPDSRDTGASQQETTRPANTNKDAGFAENSKGEFRECGVQTNMQQTGVVRPVVRGTETSTISRKIDIEDYKQRKQAAANNDVNNNNEANGDIDQKLAFFDSRLRKLQNLVMNVARDTPSRKTSLLVDYLDTIRELWRMFAINDMDRLKSFVKDEEQKLSRSVYWVWTNGLIDKCETTRKERTRTGRKWTSESNTRGHIGKGETVKSNRKHTPQIRSYSSKSSRCQSGRDVAARPSVEKSCSETQHSSRRDRNNSKPRHNDRIDDSKRSTVRSPSRENASKTRPIIYRVMDAESPPRDRPNHQSVDGGMRIECRISARVSEERPSRSSDLSLLQRNPQFRTEWKKPVRHELDYAHDDMAPSERIPDIRDLPLPIESDLISCDDRGLRSNWHRPLVNEDVPSSRTYINPFGKLSIDDQAPHEHLERRELDDIYRNEDSATFTGRDVLSIRDPRVRKRHLRDSSDQDKRSRQEHLYPNRIPDRSDGYDNCESNHNNDPHDGDLRTLIPKNSEQDDMK